MKNNVCLVGLCLLVGVSTTYCPVKWSYLDKMWLFLSQNIETPSVANWTKMTEDLKKDWRDLYENNPTVFMTSGQRQEYISILDDIEHTLSLTRLDDLYDIKTEDQRAALLANVHERLNKARIQNF